jgi:amino acid transporter
MHKFSLTTTILMNINIILGQGLFINTALLASSMGTAGALAYLAVGFTIIPIIFAFSHLMKQHPKASIFDHVEYAFGKVIGFIAGFGYSVGKLGSSALAVHVCNMIAQLVIPELSSVPILYLDLFVIGIFVMLNLLNLKMGALVQKVITILKTVPILFGIIGGLYAFSLKAFIANAHPSALPKAFSFALFAFAGFEATLAITPKLKDPRDGLRAVLWASAIVITILCLYQTMFSGALGQALINASNWLDAFTLLSKRLLGDTLGAHILTRIMATGVAVSAFGSGYSIMFSSSWNVYTIARHGLLPNSKLLTRLSLGGVPTYSVILQGIICATYILLARGSQIPMQQLSVLGLVVAYTLIAASFLKNVYSNPNIPGLRALSWLSLGSSLLFVAALIRNVAAFGAWPLAVFTLAMVPLSIIAHYKQSSPATI